MLKKAKTANNIEEEKFIYVLYDSMRSINMQERK